jgi:hypothetical protein
MNAWANDGTVAFVMRGKRIKRDISHTTDHLMKSATEMTGTRGALDNVTSMTTDGRSQIIERRGAGWLGAGAGTEVTSMMRGGHDRQERGEIATDTAMKGARRSFDPKRMTRGRGRLRTEPEPSPRQLFI